MKKIALLSALALSLFATVPAGAKVNINIQFGAPVAQQSWYARDNDYIYMPDQGAYYNNQRGVYVFQDGGRWITARRLPARFGNVSYRTVRTVRMRTVRPFERDFDNSRRYAVVENRNRINDRGFGNNNGRDGRDGRSNDYGRGRR